MASSHAPSEPMQKLVDQYQLDPEAVWELTGRIYTLISNGPKNEAEWQELTDALTQQPCMVDLWKFINVFQPPGSLLFQAANSGCTRAIPLLVQAGSLRDCTPEMRTEQSLLQAIRQRKTETALALVESNVGVNFRDSDTWNVALHECLAHDEKEVFDALLKRNDVLIDPQNKRRDTPLIQSCQMTNWGTKELLLRGANLNHQNFVSRTPLFMAFYKRNIPALNILLDYGADMTLLVQDLPIPEAAKLAHARGPRHEQTDLGASIDTEMSRKWSKQLREANALWDDIVAHKRTLTSLQTRDMYLLCNIGKAEELFMQESWQEPKAAEHALRLIDGLIPCHQQTLLMARTMLEPFAPAPKPKGVHTVADHARITAVDIKRGHA